MGLKVVDLDERDLQRLCETLGKRYADKKRAKESGAACESHCVEVAFVDAGIAQCGVDSGYNVLLMGARRKFRNHATKLLVYFL